MSWLGQSWSVRLTKILSYFLCRIKPQSFEIKHWKFSFYEIVLIQVSFKKQEIFKSVFKIVLFKMSNKQNILFIHFVGTFHHFLWRYLKKTRVVTLFCKQTQRKKKSKKEKKNREMKYGWKLSETFGIWLNYQIG